MSDAETILQKCNEMLSLREKALDKEWQPTISKDNTLGLWQGVSGEPRKGEQGARRDAEFIAFAANHSAQLAKALKICVAQLRGYASLPKGTYDGPEDIYRDLGDGAQAALTEAALILKEGTL